jgi:hypothetical protein
MANKRFSDLDAAAALTGTELVALSQSGTSRKSLLSAIKSFVLSALGNVNNTSDANKPVSTLQAAADAATLATAEAYTASYVTTNLGNVNNTSDANKPVSTAQAAADALRVLKAGDTMTGLLTMTGPVGTDGQIVIQTPVTGSAKLSLASVDSTASVEMAANGNVLGTSGFLLRQDSTSRALLTNRANADMNFTTNNIVRMTITAAGAVAFGTSNTLVGTAGQVLTSGGSAAAPTWATFAAPAGTLTGATLAAGVTASSLTSFGASPTLTTPAIGAATGTSLVLTGSVTAAAAIPSGATVPTNGMFLPAANAVAFSTASTERLRLDALGNIIEGVTATPPTLGTNLQLVMNLTSNTNLRISARGTDGTTRVVNLTLA